MSEGESKKRKHEPPEKFPLIQLTNVLDKDFFKHCCKFTVFYSYREDRDIIFFNIKPHVIHEDLNRRNANVAPSTFCQYLIKEIISKLLFNYRNLEVRTSYPYRNNDFSTTSSLDDVRNINRARYLFEVK